MKKITSFFLICSGADSQLLQKCPTETSKYAGIGATIFFIGLFAALAGGYALHMVFDSIWISSVFGLLWGLMIFNLDRYIVSSMRKDGKFARELLSASPRIILAVIISIVIAKPLELKIFEKEINPELIIMEQEVRTRQEEKVKLRYTTTQDSLKNEIDQLRSAIVSKGKERDTLAIIAQQEADGTGGSRKKNLGPIYKVKKADADRVESELQQLRTMNEARIKELEILAANNDRALLAEITAIERTPINGPAARLEALDRLSESSAAIAWANWFILLLFIALETAPVLVKLISSRGPYDNLLKVEEHNFVAMETEEMAKTNAAVKERSNNLPQHEKDYITNILNGALKS
jgi:hypothetical protein